MDNPEPARAHAWEWHSADEIFYDIMENPSARRFGVRRFLQPFDHLLAAAGVGKIEHAVLDDVLPPIWGLYSAEIDWKTIMNSFRTSRHMTDVLFIADGGAEIAAHRCYLSAKAPHFLDMFGHSGNIEAAEFPTEHIRIEKEDYAEETLEFVLRKYLKRRYRGEF